MSRPRFAAVGVLGSLVLVLGACGDDGNDQVLSARADRTAGLRPAQPADGVGGPGTTATTVAPTGVVVPVIALDNSFRPEVVEVAVGDEVRWENRGINEHDVLRVDGNGWGVEIDGFQPGDAYSHVFTEPGNYRYYCSIHGNEDVGMVGTVVVTG